MTSPPVPAPGLRPLPVAGGLVGVALLAGVPSALGTQGAHTVVETAAALLALTAGSVALVHYYGTRERTLLYVATAFLLTALLDAFHAAITSATLHDVFPSSLTALIPWSWTTSRLALATLLLLGWIVGGGRFETEAEATAEELRIYVVSGLAAVAFAVSLVMVELPSGYFGAGPMYRPQELLSAGLFAASAVGYSRRGDKDRMPLDEALMVCLVVAVAGQLMMPFAQDNFHYWSRAAHGAKALSYAAVVAGLLLSTATVFHSAVESEASVRRAFRVLFDSASTGVYVSTPAGELVDCNPALARMLGHATREDALGSGVELLYPEPSRRQDFLSQLRRHGETEVAEETLRAVDGRVLHVVEYAVGNFDEAGALTEIYGYLIDVSAQRAAEMARDQLAEALTQAAEGVLLTDAEGRIQRVNPAWEAMAGVAAEDAIGHTPRIVKSGVHDPAFYAELWETITRGDTWAGRIVNRHASGELYHVDATISPVRGEGGAIVGFLSFQKDITREMALEEQLQASQRLEVVGQLAAGVAHDFNNLLTAVMMSAELALPELAEDHPARPALDEALSAAEAGRSLTRSLLAFARKQPLDPRVVDFSETVAEAEGLLRRTLPESIHVHFDTSPDAGTVRIDARLLHSVLLNLAINARDAMPDGGRLTVSTRRVELDEEYVARHAGSQPGPHAVLTVTDTGHGMSPETLERVFQPFFTTKEAGRGTGLGLSMVYGTVKQSGGSVWAYSEPGVGTTMELLFPHTGDPLEAAVANPTPRRPATVERILVVEDDEGVRNGVARMLETLGYEVVAVDDPHEALATVVSARAFGLVLTDIGMRGMSGVEMIGRMREMGEAAHVVFMSGYLGVPRQSLPPGSIFLEKPFTMRELAAKVEEGLATSP